MPVCLACAAAVNVFEASLVFACKWLRAMQSAYLFLAGFLPGRETHVSICNAANLTENGVEYPPGSHHSSDGEDENVCSFNLVVWCCDIA